MKKTDGRQGGYVDLQARMGGTGAASIRKAGQKIIRHETKRMMRSIRNSMPLPRKLPVSFNFPNTTGPFLLRLECSIFVIHTEPQRQCSRGRKKFSCLIILCQQEVDG